MKLYLVVAVSVFGLLLLSMLVGSSQMGVFEFLSWLQGDTDATVLRIFGDVRLPRTLTGFFAGAALGLSGVFLQTYLGNRLAEPYTLGISGSSSLGAILVLLIGVEPSRIFIPIFSFLGSLIGTSVILSVSRKLSSSRRIIVLTGMMVSLFCGSFVTVAMTMLKPYELQTATFWMVGQIGTSRDTSWPLLAIVFAIAGVWAVVRTRDLDRLLAGEDTATTLGTNLSRFQTELIGVTAALTASVIAVAGMVGFVGLLAPNLAQALSKSPRSRDQIILAPLIGAALFVSADVAVRALSGPIEIPAGGLTSLFGVPVLAFFLFRGARSA